MENVERERERERETGILKSKTKGKKKDGQFSKLGQQSLTNQP
jgi:hypothetical protein